MLHFDDVAGLLRDGVLSSITAAVRRSPTGPRYTAINEHAQHAVFDFCQAVYASWEQLQRRLAAAEHASNIRANHEADQLN